MKDNFSHCDIWIGDVVVGIFENRTRSECFIFRYSEICVVGAGVVGEVELGGWPVYDGSKDTPLVLERCWLPSRALPHRVDGVMMWSCAHCVFLVLRTLVIINVCLLFNSLKSPFGLLDSARRASKDIN